MADAIEQNRRATDRGPLARARAWWSSNWFAAVVFVLLGVIVAGEASDFLDDRARTDREGRLAEDVEDVSVAVTEVACAVTNVAAQSGDSLTRLRAYGPTLNAAREIFQAQTREEIDAAVDRLRSQPVPEFGPDDISPLKDCN